MYNIAQNEIASVNGLGGDGNFTENAQTWSNIINETARSVAEVTNAFKGNKNNNSNNNNGQFVGDNTTNPLVYTGAAQNYIGTPKNDSGDKTDYLPWIIGGVAVLGLFLFMDNGKKRR